ncbi:MAG TPA: protein kinase, partial [Pyrinomonadaceae bacterium]|nr:protein kinase [Pyrinomonadaceae bacterium]
SALNHPNIVTIYEIGESESGDAGYIVMEHIEGDSLRRLISGRKISLKEAVEAAIQTASALAAAHSAGIIHRDIKPENIIRRPDGLVKILDFGLAKQTSFPHDSDWQAEPDAPLTREKIVTAPGVVMGTPAYISPEQIRGKAVDARADVWSFGIVLYEMVTGRVPFTGETNSDMMAAILKSAPEPLSLYAGNTPERLERIVGKALEKEREQRYRVIEDLLLDLKLLQAELDNPPAGKDRADSASTDAEQAENAESVKTGNFLRGRQWLWLGAPALILPAVLAFWYFGRENRPAATNFSATLSASQIASWKSELSELDASRARFSPKGDVIAYVASKNGSSAIWLKQIGGGEPFTRRQDDARETSPLWSPDGSQIAYVSERGGRRGIWATPAQGGAPALLAPLEARSQGLVHWSQDGATVYFEMRQNLHALDIASKQITKLTNFDEARPIERGFSFSPDEKRIVYADRRDGRKDLWTADLNGGNPARLTDDGDEDSQPIWHADGERVVYNSYRNGIRQLCLAFIDGRQPPVQLTFSDSDSRVSDISKDGTKILYTSAKDDSDLWGVRLDGGSNSAGGGREFQLTSDIGVEFWQDAAPNGETIVYQAARQTSVGDKLFQCLILSQKITGEARATELAGDGFNPRWSPDGNHLAFLRPEAGNNSLWMASATGGDARALTTGGVVFGGYTLLPYNRFQTQDFQWSPDSRSLIYCASRNGVANVWQTAVDGSGEKQLTANEDKNLLFFNPIFSADGRQIVWSSMTVGNPNQRIWSLWTLSAEDGKPRPFYISESVLRLVGWSASGRGLIVKSVDRSRDTSFLPGEVYLFEVGFDGSIAGIANLDSAYFQNIALSPDRKTLGFVARQAGSDTIQIMSAASGGGRATPKTLIGSNDVRVYFSSLSFAPDGKTIYYGKQANWQIISMINNFK